jgi:hypothetical protein
MPHDLSLLARRALNAPETGEVFLPLLTLEHPALDAPLRVVGNTVKITSRGDVYLAYPFELALADSREDQLARVTLRIDNVDRRIVEAVRSLPSAATVTLEIVLASHPDVIERSDRFSLREVFYDALVVEGTLMYEDVLNFPFTQHLFTPQTAPGLFP